MTSIRNPLQSIRDPLTVGGLTLRNRLFLAPVDGVFKRSFRRIAADMGVGLTCSEMIAARGFEYSAKIQDQARPADEERPFCVQLSEHDPEILARAARRIEDRKGADIVDLNMGCPSRTVVNSGNGSALLKSPERVRDIVRAVRKAIRLPLSVKIRIGWDDPSRNALEISKIIEEEGADLITVHGRTRAQMFGGAADWNAIGEVKAKRSIPVIGNGDVFSAETARELLARTGCDGVMIARGAFGNPWLIRRILRDDDAFTPSHEERRDTILAHLRAECEQLGEDGGVKFFRKHLAWYVKGLPGAATFRREAMIIPERNALEERIHLFFEATR